ncbi:CHAP domain-containing protein [Streptococcus tangpeifui]|uniref:CHAP domain-containing protein n=1 Tax=Streptococcus tangpeifui TaxID=2709400 RepID=UPI0013EBF2C7|nr:CHAP domain-containing protein [Streptococcus sp. ZJ373]
MKKEKLLSLTLLFLLSSSYLASGVTLAEAVSNSARSPREEQGDLGDGESVETSSSTSQKESLDESKTETKATGEETSDEDNSAKPLKSGDKEDKPVAPEEEGAAYASSQSGSSLQKDSDERLESTPEIRRGNQSEQEIQSADDSPSDQQSSGKDAGSDSDKTQKSESKPVAEKKITKTEESEKQSVSYCQSPQLPLGQANVLVRPFFDGYWAGKSAAVYFNDKENEAGESTGPLTYTTYVEHWSGQDAYSHNLLSHRYGVKAEQLDGYLNSLGLAYDNRRINGKLLLKWEKETGLDVRAIVAIALHESSLGTAGVATLPGSNMFGYGAFDNNPNQASHFNDSQAISKMVGQTIIQNKNWTFKIQDDKAAKNALGQLDVISDGGVYFTDTSGSGKRRAQTMQELDTWIDQHGGTPEIPEKLKHLSGISQATLPTGYQLSRPMTPQAYQALSYPWGQCTWYVYNRARELGYSFDPYMGNGGDWQFKSGYNLSHQPKVGYAVSFAPGQAGADPDYGHVAIVEQVKKDGSILISESNALGSGVISYRIFTADQAAELTYVIGKPLP